MKRLIAISDIHGCFDTFYELLIGKIDLKKSDKLVLLGDYIDRGLKSKEVIDFIIDLQTTGFDVVPLRGNHEDMLIQSLKNNEMVALWYMNSGMITMESFGLTEISGFESRYITFFENLSYFLTIDRFIFVHAGFNDGIPDPFSDTGTMLWECRKEYLNPVFEGKTIIHGHRPKTLEFVLNATAQRSGVIPIDTGCIYDKELGYGILSALELNSMKLISLSRI
jgi:serine/threonine protein phosphatase 1